MSRMTKTLKAVQRETQNNDGTPQALDISSIEKASFFHGDPYSPHGNPLHSTALEEDLSPGPEQNHRSAPEKTDRPRAGKPAETHKTKAKEMAQTVSKSAASKENQEPSELPNQKAKGRSLPTISEGREDTDTRRASAARGLTVKRKGGAYLSLTRDPPIANHHHPINSTQTQSSPAYTRIYDTVKKKRQKAGRGQRSAKETPQRSPLSSEDLTDEDESFRPSMEKSKGGKRRSSSQRQSGHKHRRKTLSSSDGRPLQKTRDLRSPTDLDVVLDAFQEFVTQYKQTITSDPVKRSIDAVSRSFEEQLSEMITATNELKSVKRENNKINSTINQKRTRLVEASNELIKGKTKLRDLQKDHDEMEQRLKALREGGSLIASLQELNRKYLEHRTAHPEEVETYGPSCMPAMLMEARGIMGAEHQLKTVNDCLQQVLDETENP